MRLLFILCALRCLRLSGIARADGGAADNLPDNVRPCTPASAIAVPATNAG